MIVYQPPAVRRATNVPTLLAIGVAAFLCLAFGIRPFFELIAWIGGAL